MKVSVFWRSIISSNVLHRRKSVTVTQVCWHSEGRSVRARERRECAFLDSSKVECWILYISPAEGLFRFQRGFLKLYFLTL
jgi:hypothetical protein